MRAQSAKERVQGVRRGEHLPARSEKEHVQGVRRGGHLPARSEKEQVQDVQSRQGRLDAAGPRGALKVTHTLLHTGFSQRHIGSANVLDNAGLGHIQRLHSELLMCQPRWLQALSISLSRRGLKTTRDSRSHPPEYLDQRYRDQVNPTSNLPESLIHHALSRGR